MKLLELLQVSLRVDVDGLVWGDILSSRLALGHRGVRGLSTEGETHGWRSCRVQWILGAGVLVELRSLEIGYLGTTVLGGRRSESSGSRGEEQVWRRVEEG